MWLAESVTPARRGEESLGRGLARYRRKYARELRGHAFFIHNYATGRRLNPAERLMFSAGARDRRVAATLDAYATRRIKPGRMVLRAAPRSIIVNARHALAR